MKRLSNSGLKNIAAIAMILDHIGAILIWPYVSVSPAMNNIYITLRIIGRLAYPIYCFLLVEGMKHTHDIRKYIKRMFVLGLLSEVPYDLAFNNSIISLDGQNIFFTLTTSLVILSIIKEDQNTSIPYKLLLIFIGMLIGHFCRLDGDWFGVLIPAIIYYCKNDLFRQFVLLLVVYVLMGGIQPFALLAIPVYQQYNQNKGNNTKLYYLIYPVHLLLLYLISLILVR